MNHRRLVVLGATGSIGSQALEVAGRLGIAVAGLAASKPSPAFDRIRAAHPQARVAVASDDGQAAVDELARIPECTVVNGIVGAVGLGASVAAVESGNRLALANKESLIAGAEVIEAARRAGGGELIPVDSEHSALHQLLASADRAEVGRLVITASGGPFRGWSAADLAEVTPAQALAHPTWSMGRRISVDSATLVNKGLEVIEAHALFGFDFDDIEVVVHPQSIVHSLVRLADGALLAHAGVTDMRVPIQYAVTYPGRMPLPEAHLDLTGLTLSFEAPDRGVFPALDLAYAAGRAGRSSSCAFNAADEVAVEAFLDGRIGFTDIPRVIEEVVEAMPRAPMRTVAEVMAADAEARRLAGAAVERRTT